MAKFFCVAVFALLPCCGWADTLSKQSADVWEQKALSKADFSFLKVAVVSKGNDLDYFQELKGEQISIPEKVRGSFQTEAKSDYKGLLEFVRVDLSSRKEGLSERDAPEPRQIYGPIYSIEAPDSMTLYILKVSRGSSEGSEYWFVLSDSKNVTVTKTPVRISSRWVDVGDKPEDFPLLKKPFVSFENIGGRNALVIEEFVHNGNVTNAAVYHYFFIGDDLSLNEVFKLEARSLVSSGLWREKGYGQITRKIVSKKKDRVTVETMLEGTGKTPIDVGTLFLKRDDSSSTFKVVRRVVKDKRLKELLFLFSSEEEK